MIYRMQDMPSSHLNDAEAKAVLKFVIWDANYSNDAVKTLMAFDRDGDGKLSRSELPERLQGLFDRADANRDGSLTGEEIRKLAASQGPPVGRCDGEHRERGSRIDARRNGDRDGHRPAGAAQRWPKALNYSTTTARRNHDPAARRRARQTRACW